MYLKKEEYDEIIKNLNESKLPLFIHHDDADGITSFLLLYLYKKTGERIIVKSSPHLDMKFYNKIKSFAYDKIFIVDIALVEQELINKLKTQMFWIDHHGPYERHGIKYYNPRKHDKKNNIPASCICYELIKNYLKEEDKKIALWIAMVGAIGDWHYPKFAEEFKKEFPDLLDENIRKPEDALFNSKLGELVKIFGFLLKGKIDLVEKNIALLKKIKTPYDILNQKTKEGEILYENAKKIYSVFNKLLNEAEKQVKEDKLVIYIYENDNYSFSKDIANELIYKYPNKAIIVGRKHDGSVKCSLRGDFIIPKVLEKALIGIEGYGGGHEYACGACIDEKDFDRFIENYKQELKKLKN